MWKRSGCLHGWLVTPVALLAGLAGCARAERPVFVYQDLPVIDLPDGAVEILPGTGVLDSPVLSPDGKRLAVQVEIYRDPALPYELYSLAVAERGPSGAWQKAEIIANGVYKKFLGRMEMPIQPSFDETGERLLLTQIRFDSGLSIPWAHTIRSWVERMPWKGGPAERLIEYRDWGLRPTELLQHARVSPNGRWLAFYTRVHKATQGVYVLDLRTGEHYRLSTTHDKHPTWSPDGRRIYFHTVVGGKRHRFDFFAAGQERSVLGFFDLKIENDRLVGWERHLFDEIGNRFIYQKHPSEVVGTGLLFFHGRLKPDGNMKLMVRSTEPGSTAFVVRPSWKGKHLKAAKHPCSSFEVADLVFIAKPKKEKRYRLLMSLTDEALKKVERVVRAAQAGS